MYAVRRWSVRHAAGMETFYNAFERVFVGLHPLWKWIGYDRMEKPVATVEKVVKGFLFDCQMCGQCALSSTGMSCSMNCPKNLRNGEAVCELLFGEASRVRLEDDLLKALSDWLSSANVSIDYP